MNPAWTEWLDRVVAAVAPIPEVEAVYRGNFNLFPAVYVIGKGIKGKSYQAVMDAINAIHDPPYAHAKLIGAEPLAGTHLVWKRPVGA